MTALAHSPTNDQRLQDLVSEVREFGRDAAQGKDSLPKLALKVAFAAADGVISLDKDSDGTDDASRLYSEYQKAESKKAVHEHSAGGTKANASKLRQIITAGSMTTCDFYASINKAILKRDELHSAEVKVRPAYHTIVEMAREQIGQADDLTDDQIEALCKKPEPGETTLEGEIKRMNKIAENLIKGEKGVKCDEQWLLDIQQTLASQITTFALKRETAETIAKAKELGLSIVERDIYADVAAAVTLKGNESDEQVAA
jgi:hypothetical protein